MLDKIKKEAREEIRKALGLEYGQTHTGYPEDIIAKYIDLTAQATRERDIERISTLEELNVAGKAWLKDKIILALNNLE